MALPGIAKAQIGDLVTTTSVLTSVSQVDPIKVYFPMSEQDYLRAQKIGIPAASVQSTPLKGVPLTLVLANGNIYPHTGEVLWTDRQVGPKHRHHSHRGGFSQPRQHPAAGRIRQSAGRNRESPRRIARTPGRGDRAARCLPGGGGGRRQQSKNSERADRLAGGRPSDCESGPGGWATVWWWGACNMPARARS